MSENSNKYDGKTDAERQLEAAERELSDPASINMQILNETVGQEPTQPESNFSVSPRDSLGGNSTNSVSPSVGQPTAPSSMPFSAADAFAATTAGSIVSQAGAASPTQLGRGEMSEGAVLNAASPGALQAAADQALATKEVDTLAQPKQILPASEFQQLMAALDNPELFLDDAMDPQTMFNALMDTETPMTPEQLQQTIDSVTFRLETLQDTFEPIINDLALDVQNAQSEIQGSTTQDITAGIIEDSSSLTGTLEEFGATDTLDAIEEALDTDSLIDEVEGIVDSVTDSVGSGGLNIPDTVADAVDPIVDGVDGVVDGVTDVVDDVTDVVDDVTGGATDEVTDVVNGVTDVVDGVTDEVGGTVGDVVSLLGDDSEGLPEGLEGLVDDGLGLLSGQTSEGGSDSDLTDLGDLSGISSNAGDDDLNLNDPTGGLGS
ncbi:MAG: hypothetical protein R3194_03170 [Limnobacter sp.]|nr:hypothetical protein [Limnobacter sp.]